MSDLDLETVAIHEAGHAVVALALGRVVGWAIVAPTRGTTWIGIEGATRSTIAIIAMAGSIAEGRAEIRTSDASKAKGTGLSEAKLVDLAFKTCAMIVRHKGAVAAVATALRDRGRLSALALKRIALVASPALRELVAPIPRELVVLGASAIATDLFRFDEAPSRAVARPRR